jgi:hypothetical protein
MEAITVKALAQRKLKYSWPTRLVAREGDLIVLYGDWGRPLRYASGDVTPVTNRSLEFYWLKKPYAIAAIFDKDWELREYYGRVIEPPKLSGGELELAMLGYDLQINSDYDYEIVELEQGGSEGEAERGLIELIELIERREGPFDREFLGGHLTQVRRVLPVEP